MLQREYLTKAEQAEKIREKLAEMRGWMPNLDYAYASARLLKQLERLEGRRKHAVT